ncbi:CAP1-binding-protein [Candida viswanathii]|uniref:CAP1-binding-protein n=1 Tax=Candida viswanathii TaxID=5486 RepID=A0A367YEX0_9ASCO|nr:CAP1-binding-protein [Candida viswanathii]
MSETDHSETSESTIEPFQFDKILENLQHGAADAKESQDFLSYSTLLDIYLNDPTKYSNDEKEQLMGHLLEILSNDPELTAEIGWDIPQLVILYVESDYDFKGPIRSSPCVYKVLKIFETLAIDGNPKELFLKSCELLSSLEISDDENLPVANRENFYEIKVYCVFELIDSCLKRIKTLYPSRFLLMTVSAFINLAHKLNRHDTGLGTYHFILKRAYSFARNYVNLPLPDDIDVSKEDLEKITQDEEYLQRKLLTGFITNIVYLTNIKAAEGYAMDHFSWLQRQQSHAKLIFEYEVDPNLPDRFVELAYSFDLELMKNFQTFITDAHKLLIPIDRTKSTEEITAVIFEKLVIDYQKNVFASIVNSDMKEIKDSVIAELILYTHPVAMTKEFNKPTMTIADVLALTLRLIVPQMVSPLFINFGVADMVIFWIWFTLYQLQKLHQHNLTMQIERIPKPLFTIFLQCILFVIITGAKEKPRFRFMVLTLLTKILILCPGIGYEFIKDSLQNCPYEAIKSPLIGVYKELLLKNSINVDAINLESLKIYNGESKSAGAPPPLPPRDTKPGYELTNEKLDDLLALIEVAESEAFVDDSIDPSKLSTIAALLNLLVALKKDSVVVTPANKEKIGARLASVEKNIDLIKSSSSNQFEINAADMLKLTIERFKE